MQLLALVQTDAELGELADARVHPPAAGAHRARHRRRRAHRLAAFAGHAADAGVPHAQRPSASPTSTSTATPDVQTLLDRFHVSGDGSARAHLPRRRRAPEPDQRSRSPTASASTRRSTRARSATWSSSAPGPSGWPPPSTARPKGSTSSCSKRTRPAARPGSSSKIENYLGFPTGSPGRSSRRARYTQAQKFGAELVIANGAMQLDVQSEALRASQIEDGPRRAGADGHHRDRRASTGSRRFANLSAVRGRRRLLRRDLAMEAQLCAGRGGDRRRRRQLRRTGGGVPRRRPRSRVHMLVRVEQPGRAACRAT